MFFKHDLPLIPERPAYVAHYEGYKPDDCIRFTKEGIIIILKKEGKKMGARTLVIDELNKLSEEKNKVVAELVEANRPEIEAKKIEAAQKAEDEYVASIKEKVNKSYSVAENHLNSILNSLPEEETEVEKTEEIKCEEPNNDQI